MKQRARFEQVLGISLAGTALLSACAAEVVDGAVEEEEAVVSTAEALTLEERIAGCQNDPRVLARVVSLDVCVGADLFFRETFNGNGRSCTSCHRVENNYTIDPAFIATLPSNDPLFVAEFNSTLANLERPAQRRAQPDPRERRRLRAGPERALHAAQRPPQSVDGRERDARDRRHRDAAAGPHRLVG